MANGFLEKIPGVGNIIKKLGGGHNSSSNSSTTQSQPVNVGQSGQSGWAPRNGVNGTTSPKGIGKWGSGV
jgi:hypothetical protein